MIKKIFCKLSTFKNNKNNKYKIQKLGGVTPLGYASDLTCGDTRGPNTEGMGGWMTPRK